MSSHTTGPSEIHRADQTRVAIVSSNLRDIDLGTAVEEVRELVAANPLGADIRLRVRRPERGAGRVRSTRCCSPSAWRCSWSTW